MASNLMSSGSFARQTAGSSFMHVWIEPFVQRCCWDLKPFISTGNSAGRHEIRQENEAPALELRAVAEVEVFGERIVLPAAGIRDAGAPPEASGAVEIEKASAPAAGGLLEQKMSIQEHGLDARENGVGAVQMPPAGLDHPDFRIGEISGSSSAACPARRHEIRIENENEFSLARNHARLEGAGFETRAIRAMDEFDVEARRPCSSRDPLGGDLGGLIGGVVEHLHLEKLSRVFERGDRFQEPLDDVKLIENGKLDRDPRQLLETSLSGCGGCFRFFRKR